MGKDVTAEAAAKRDAKGRFGAGNLANPGGRSVLPAEFRAHGPAALLRLVEFMENKNEKIALRATELVAERIYGRPTQPMEHSGQDLLDLVAERVSARMNGHSESSPKD